MKHFDAGTILVIVVTFILFIVALFFKGLTHDLLLEAAIFLVSVKLIIMAYKTSKSSRKIESELKDIKEILTQNKKR
jgi:flagellar motor component MotA